MVGNVRFNTRVYLRLVFLLVLFFVFVLVSFFLESVKQKKIIAIRNLLEETGIKEQQNRENFSDHEPLLLDKSILRQTNDGPDLQDKNFRPIKVRSYGTECVLVSSEKGIWW